jgi:hypothetical protein
MGATYRAEFPIHVLYRVIVPVLAGVVILVAGFLPWLVEPLQSSVTAWQIPVDVGWQIRFSAINYGLFCLLCALYPFVIAYRAWRSVAQSEASPVTRTVSLSRSVRSCIVAAWLCCMPVGLWLWQYLFVDLGSVAQLTRQEIQYMLTTQHFDYSVISPLMPITNPLAFDPLSLYGRFMLLVDQLGIGPFFPLFSAVLLVIARKLFMDFLVRTDLSYSVSNTPAGTDLLCNTSKDRLTLPMDAFGGLDQAMHAGEGYPVKEHNRPLWAIAFVIVLLLVIVFERAPLALVCNYQAQDALYAGDYAGAYRWFGYASELNPALELLSSYHIAQGQTWYFLHLHQDSVDSRAYLASAYLEQKDYLSAYQELNRVWQSGERAPWLADEMSMILTQLAIVSLPGKNASLQHPAKDSAALSWLNQLLYVDPHNVFGQYMVGRIQYDLHNYSQCEAAMRRVIALSQSTNVLSSAYTYLALSSDGQGDYVDARVLLLRAVSLDPKYRNNTAREELSGLR